LVHEIKIRFPEHKHKDRLKELQMLTVEDKIAALKTMSQEEEAVLLAKTTVERHEIKRDIAVALAVEKLVPCILHMKLRLTEKLFHCLINSALERYGDSPYDANQRKLFDTTISECIRGKILGNEECGRPSQFTFTWCKGNRSVEKPSFTGSGCNKVLVGLKKLATQIFDPTLDEESENNDERLNVRTKNSNLLATWLSIGENLVPMWKLIEQHDDFTQDQILQLHKRCNTFMCQWVELYGHVHITNYIHIIGSGHLPYFAKKYGNLYRFSQQGWEALNQMIKHFYFNNTNHGGSSGNGGKGSDGTFNQNVVSGNHCLPLMRLCQRNLMWKLKLGDAYFLNKEINRVSKTKVGTDEDNMVIELHETSDNEEENMMFGVL
jgi:hypothetical protein